MFWVNHIALGFAHLFHAASDNFIASIFFYPVSALFLYLFGKQPIALTIFKALMANHALCHQSGERLIQIKIAHLGKGAGEKARI